MLTADTRTVETGPPGPEAAPPIVARGNASTIEARGLRKSYGKGVNALEALDLSVPPAAVGLLGANGAGKTTLIRLLLGLAKPSSGSATVLGFDTATHGAELRRYVGYMPESDCLPAAATAADFVSHMAEMSGLPARAARQRAADVLYQVGLDEERYRLIKGFSTGMKQRVKLAQAIVHDPALVFLDEPTNGMDPKGRDEMLDLIVRIHRMMGISVVVSSHILEDIERVCDYVVILSRGKLVLSQPIGNLGGDDTQLLVRIDGNSNLFMRRLEGLGLDVRRSQSEDLWEEIIIQRNDDRAYDIVRDVAAELDLPLRGLRTRAHSLEDVYFGSIREEDAEPQPEVTRV
jgi:ABC-2 type transport system ATP-binding protein